MAPGRLCATLLQPLSQRVVASAVLLHLLAAKGCASAVRRQIDDTQVYPKRFIRFKRLWRWGIKGDCQITRSS
jgi:hypothetical protein